MKVSLYNDGIGYITDEVSTVPSIYANFSEEMRIKFVTDMAAVSRGKFESNNAFKRYDKLLKEAAPTRYRQDVIRTYNKEDIPLSNTPSRPLEFIPVVLNLELDGSCVNLQLLNRWYTIPLGVFINRIGRYSFIDDGRLYTNLRCLLNAGIEYNQIPYNDFKEVFPFKAFRAKIPMFVWSQFMTHTQISKESQSDRVAEESDYWLPYDFNSRLIDRRQTIRLLFQEELEIFLESHEAAIDLLLNHLSQMECQDLFEQLGYNREIYSRAPYYFKYKEVVFAAWSNNSDTFQHFLLERNAYPELHKNWTQKETAEFASGLRQILEADKDYPYTDL
jgi:hypothetical protein